MALARGVIKPGGDAANHAQNAIALAGTLGGTAAITYLGIQLQDGVFRVTGLYPGMVPWFAGILAFLGIGGFVAWRTQDRRIQEFEGRFIAKIEPHLFHHRDLLTLQLKNSSAAIVQNCEVRLILARSDAGLEHHETIAFKETGNQKTLFDIPPFGLTTVTLISRSTRDKDKLFLGDGRFAVVATAMYEVPFKKGHLVFQVQASNIVPFTIDFDLTDNVDAEISDEPSRRAEEKEA